MIYTLLCPMDVLLDFISECRFDKKVNDEFE